MAWGGEGALARQPVCLPADEHPASGKTGHGVGVAYFQDQTNQPLGRASLGRVGIKLAVCGCHSQMKGRVRVFGVLVLTCQE